VSSPGHARPPLDLDPGFRRPASPPKPTRPPAAAPAQLEASKQHIITIYEHGDTGPHSWRVTFGMTAHRNHVVMGKRLPDLIDLLVTLAPAALASEHGQQAPPAVPKPGKLQRPRPRASAVTPTPRSICSHPVIRPRGQYP
jgi:hypothetical protein